MDGTCAMARTSSGSPFSSSNMWNRPAYPTMGRSGGRPSRARASLGAGSPRYAAGSTASPSTTMREASNPSCRNASRMYGVRATMRGWERRAIHRMARRLRGPGS